MKSKHTFFIALLNALAFSGCTETHENPNYPNAVVNFTIYPNSIHEYELNVVGGYKYYTSDPMSTSRSAPTTACRPISPTPAATPTATAPGWWSMRIISLWSTIAMTSNTILLMVTSSQVMGCTH